MESLTMEVGGINGLMERNDAVNNRDRKRRKERGLKKDT